MKSNIPVNNLLSANLDDLSDYNNLELYIEKHNYKNDAEIVISLLLPTRNRTEYLDKFFKSLSNTTHDLVQIEVIIYVDNDDSDTREFENENVSFIKIIGPRLTMGQYNSVCYRHSSGKIIMQVNDDVIIETNNWDRLLVNQLNKIDDEIYLAYPDDGINNGKLSTFSILSRKSCEILVYPYPPIYKNLFIDTHIMDVFYRLTKKSGQRMIYLNNIKFMHYKLDSHYESDTNLQRTDYYDDYAFIALREVRISQAARLQSVIDNTGLPSIEDNYVLKKEYKNYLNSCRYFYKKFICDEGLPLIVRIKYFLRYTGHFFMIKTTLGTFTSRILNVFKRNNINSATC